MATAAKAPAKTPSPTTDQIKRARIRSGLTQSAAAELVHTDLRTWQRWEGGDHEMHPAFFELFNIKYRLAQATAKHTRT